MVAFGLTEVPEVRKAGFYWVRSDLVSYKGSVNGWHVARWEPDDDDPAEGYWYTTAYKDVCDDGAFDEIGALIEPPHAS